MASGSSRSARRQRPGFDALALHWNVLGEEARVARQDGSTRSNWRLVGPMHCAETKEQAIADVQYGIEHWFRYFQAGCGLSANGRARRQRR